jgi:UDP-glucose 4-epimerase
MGAGLSDGQLPVAYAGGRKALLQKEDSVLVLVTGATGRIGSVVVRRLLERGDRVRALVLDADPWLSRLNGLDVEIVGGNLVTGEGLTDACQRIDAVIHLGALMAFSAVDHRRLFDVNLQGTFSLLQAVHEQAPQMRRFVLASTDAAYPAAAPTYRPVDEEHPLQPDTFYGMTKQVTEVMGEYYQRQFGIRLACARFCYTLAPEEIVDPDNPTCGSLFYLGARLAGLKASPGLTAAEQADLETLTRLQPVDGSHRILVPYGEDGSSWTFTLCHVEDLVDGILLLLDRDVAVGEVFNLGPAAPFAMDEALRYLSDRTGMPYVEARLSGPAIDYRVDTGKARAMLGYAPRYDIWAIMDQAAASIG